MNILLFLVLVLYINFICLKIWHYMLVMSLSLCIRCIFTHETITRSNWFDLSKIKYNELNSIFFWSLITKFAIRQMIVLRHRILLKNSNRVTLINFYSKKSSNCFISVIAFLDKCFSLSLPAVFCNSFK